VPRQALLRACVRPRATMAWDCAVCTLENEDMHLSCAACGSTKPPQVDEVPPRGDAAPADDAAPGSAAPRAAASSPASCGMEMRVAILKFDDRNRYGESGIPTTVLFGGGKRWITNCKTKTKRNQWAKVEVPIDAGDSETRAQLVELLGPTGEHATELLAMQLHFGVKPCKYPIIGDWGLVDMDAVAARADATASRLVSIDNAGTRDIDDAVSFDVVDADTIRLGIHVADVASRIGVGTALFEWARQRGASAYNSGIDDSSGSSVPMLPPELAHGEFSLNEGVARNAVTLWLMVDVPTATITSKRHERTRVVNHAAMSYAAFGALQGGPLADARELLRRLSKTFEPEDLVAWTMIEYNAYFGEVLSAKQSWPGGVLRAQADPTAAAVYAAAIGFDDATLSHVSLQLKRYAHTSSPIRRFADLINQHAVFGTAAQAFAAAGWGDSQLATLNERAVELSRYHASVDAMELAHRCRAAPRVYSGKLEVGDEGACLLVHTEKRRVRVPLHDSYFAEPIAAAVAAGAGVDGAVEVELYGVLISNRTRLRARLVGLERPKPVGFVFEEPDCASVHDGASELPTPPQSPPQPCHDSAMDKADRAMLKLPESARARGRVGRSSSESQAARYNTARCKLGPFPRSRLETGHAPTVRCGAASKHPRGGGSD